MRLLILLAAAAIAACGSPSTPSGTASGLSTPVPVTPTPVTSGSPTAAALEGWLVLTRAGGKYGDETIFISNADGSAEEQLTPFGRSCCPRVSPDGSQLLYSAPYTGDRVTIGIMDLASREERLIDLPDATINMGPGAWSPDGTRIAVQVWDPFDPGRDGAYVIDAVDGGNLQRLTTATAPDVPVDVHGTSILLLHESMGPSVGELWIVPLDGSAEPKRVTPEGTSVGLSSARFSPDGSLIVFDQGRLSSTGHLSTIRPDGSDLSKVYADADGRFASHPSWSPDGSMILFALNPVADSYQHAANEVLVIDAAGGAPRLVIAGGDCKRPAGWLSGALPS